MTALLRDKEYHSLKNGIGIRMVTSQKKVLFNSLWLEWLKPQQTIYLYIFTIFLQIGTIFQFFCILQIFVNKNKNKKKTFFFANRN